MSFKEETVRDIKRLERKICCLNGNINDLLSEDIIAALEGANAPGAGNVFLTALDGGVGGSNIQVEANYAALPDPTTVTGEFYWAESSQGTQWLPGSLGGTYYPLGIYYSNGVSWIHIESPYQATLVTVNAGLNDNQFVTPYTFDNADKWTTKANTVHTHPQSDITDLVTDLASKVDENVAIVGATKTKITYDTKGLVTSGADATTADIADSLDKRYVTDAQLALIGASSGGGTMMVLGSDYANTNPNVTYGAWDFAVTDTKKYRVEIAGFYTTTNNAHKPQITLSNVAVANDAYWHSQMQLGGTGGGTTTFFYLYDGSVQFAIGALAQTPTVIIPFSLVFYFTAAATGTMNVTLGTTAGASATFVTYRKGSSIIIQEF